MRTAVTARFEWWLKRATGMAFDFIHDVDTRAGPPALSCDIISPNRNKAVPYDPALWRTLPRSLQLGSLRANGFTFIDIGCGKGKVLLSALAFSFKTIIGVEFSPSLCEIAKRNLSTARLVRRRCDFVQSNCSDAVGFCVPNEPSIFFLLQSFYLRHHGDRSRQYPRRTFATAMPALSDFLCGVVKHIEDQGFLSEQR